MGAQIREDAEAKKKYGVLSNNTNQKRILHPCENYTLFAIEHYKSSVMSMIFTPTSFDPNEDQSNTISFEFFKCEK